MKAKFLFSMAAATFAAILTLSCFGDDGNDGSSCIVEPKEGETGFDVLCDGELVGELLNGKDAECIIDRDSNNGESLVICNGTPVGTLYDGKPGEKGEQGEQGEGCAVEAVPDSSAYLRMTCGGSTKTWPKAVCGTNAYDPDSMNCERGSILSFTFTDRRDEKKYKAVVIGNQTWMAENLNYVDSDTLSKCYNDDAANCAKYGRLYSWTLAMGIDTSYNSNAFYDGTDKKNRGICPENWHLPSKSERWALVNVIGGENIGGTKLKAISGWKDNRYGKYDSIWVEINIDGTWYGRNNYFYHPTSGNGTDDYGFSALPAGSCYTAYDNKDYCYGLEEDGHWWVSEENNNSGAYRFLMYSTSEGTYYYSDNKKSFYSVRCIKD